MVIRIVSLNNIKLPGSELVWFSVSVSIGNTLEVL